MKYLDSNIFILPVLYNGKKADKAKNILESMANGDMSCATASLTLDEVLWVVLRETEKRKESIKLCRDIMELPNLQILSVDSSDIIVALRFMDKYRNLKPRGAIHLAKCKNSEIFTIVSDDSDFQNIDEINWEKLY